MQPIPLNSSAVDDATLDIAARLFAMARHGDAAGLAASLSVSDQSASDQSDARLSAHKVVNLRDHKGDSLLMVAAYHGHAPAVEVLLAHGADPDTRNHHGQTAIAGASFKGHVQVVESLLRHGANV